MFQRKFSLTKIDLIAAGFATFLVAFHFLFPEGQFDRPPIDAGQWWRILSGQYLHINEWHLLLNLLGFLLFVLFYGRQSSTTLLIFSLLYFPLATGLGLYLNDYVVWYKGFSGALYGLFTWVGVRLCVRREFLFGIAILAITLGKLCWDLTAGSNIGNQALIGAPVIVESHLWGVVASVPIIALELIKRFKIQHT